MEIVIIIGVCVVGLILAFVWPKRFGWILDIIVAVLGSLGSSKGSSSSSSGSSYSGFGKGSSGGGGSSSNY